jgi:hypothetical protein
VLIRILVCYDMTDSGLSDAATTISLAILGDLSLEWEIGTNYGKLGGFQGIGVILGPLVGAGSSFSPPNSKIPNHLLTRSSIST